MVSFSVKSRLLRLLFDEAPEMLRPCLAQSYRNLGRMPGSVLAALLGQRDRDNAFYGQRVGILRQPFADTKLNEHY